MLFERTVSLIKRRGDNRIGTLIGLLILTSLPWSQGSPSAQESKPSESTSPTPCDGKLDILRGFATVHVSLAGFNYGELPISGQQLRTGKTGVDRDSLRIAVLDGVRKAVQEAGYKLAVTDPDWSIAVCYFNYWKTEGNEKLEAGKTYTMVRVKRLELTFTTKAAGTLCQSVLSPKADVRTTMTGDGRGGIKTEYNAENIPKEITDIVQGLIPKHVIKQ